MRILGIAFAALIGTGVAAMAEDKPKPEQDMSTLTCEEFLQMPAPNAIMTLFWMDGYLADGNPVWNAETFVEHRDKLVTICAAEDGKDKLVLEEIKNLG